MQYIQYIKNVVVIIGFLGFGQIASSGSYDDFFKAIQFDDVKTVQALLLRGFDPNSVNPNGVPGLMVAVREPSLKVAELLASWPKVKTEIRNDKDESVLMLAALKGYLPLVKLLVDNDADVNKSGWTPLHYAASSGQVPVIKYLLFNSAYIDAESPNGTTPLMMAAMYGSPEAVKVLIQAGADMTIKNQLGLTALDFAVRGNRVNAKELIEKGLQRQAARAAMSLTTHDASHDEAVPSIDTTPKPEFPQTATPVASPATAVSPPAMSSVQRQFNPKPKPSISGW